MLDRPVSRSDAPPRWLIAVRAIPILSAIVIIAAVAGSCGKSVYSTATASPTATATVTPGAYLYVTNYGDAKISEFKRDSTNGTLTPIGTVSAGAVNGPVGITLDSSGNFLYAVNSGDNTVRQFGVHASTGALGVIGSGSIAAGTAPVQVAVDPTDSFLYAANSGGSISGYTINSSNGALGANGVTTVGLSSPYGVATASVGVSSYLYVSDDGNGQMVSYPILGSGLLGIPSTVDSLGTLAGDPGPVIVGLNDQFAYTTDMSAGTVSQFSTAAGALGFVQVVSTSAPGIPAYGLALATTPAGGIFLYVASHSVATSAISIFAVNSISGQLTLLGNTTVGLNQPTGVAVDPSGRFLYVANSGSGTVTLFSINATTGALTLVGAVNTESPANSASVPLFIAMP